MQPMRVQYGVHIPVETDLARHIRATLHDPDWFTYYHRQKRRWVAARWFSRALGTFGREFVIGPRLVGLSSEMLDALRWQNSPSTWRERHEAIQALLSDERAAERAVDDHREEWADFAAFLQRKYARATTEGSLEWQAFGAPASNKIVG